MIPPAASLLLICLWCVVAPVAAEESISLVMTGDTEGRVRACSDCPNQADLGGLARRATLLAQLRRQNPDTILVDSGNIFFGSESFISQGRIMVAAYNALAYDVANLSYRDFYFGKAVTMSLLAEAQFAVVSANLLAHPDGVLLVKPFVVKEVAGRKIAFIGLSQIPPGLDFLPHLKTQLSGIYLEPPLSALAKWLPKAKAEAQQVILLYYGSVFSLRPIRDQFSDQFAAILIAGCGPEQLPAKSKPPLIASYGLGRYVTHLELPLASDSYHVAQLPLDAAVVPNQEMAKLLAVTTTPTPVHMEISAKTDNASQATIKTEDKTEVRNQGKKNVAAFANGGCVFYLSASLRASQLLDEKTEPLRVTGAKGATALTVTLAFRNNLPVDISEVGLETPAQTDVSHYPQSMAVAFSSDPFLGFQPAGTFTIPSVAGKHTFALASPVTARFLKVSLHNHNRCLVLSELMVYGTRQEGVLQSATPEHSEENSTFATAELQENEPNDESGKAQKIEIGQWLQGSSAATGDSDWYRCSLAKGEDVLRLELRGRPFVRQTIRIYNSAQQEIYLFPASQCKGDVVDVELPLPPGEYSFSLTSSPVYLTFGFDISGSMQKTFTTSKKIILETISTLLDGEMVAIASSAKTKKGWGKFYCDFSRDPQVLTTSAEQVFQDDGTSDWYSILSLLLEKIDEMTPADSVRALTYLADGAGSGDYEKMWQKLQKSHVRIYTIGMGERMAKYFDNAHGVDAARSLFNVAWYRRGRYYQPGNNNELSQVYQKILSDIRQPTQYQLRLQTRRRLPGTLTVAFAEPSPILIVLDSSGSMLGHIGGRKKQEIAREVIAKIIAELPPEIPVGLRAYGHRYRPFGHEANMTCTDSELTVPITPHNRKELLASLAGLECKGKTPMAYTLGRVSEDIKSFRKTILLLLGDGEESCKQDPVSAAAALKKKHPAVEIHVVGFTLRSKWATEQLHKIAAAGGGVYRTASSATDFLQAILATVTTPYNVLDDSGQVLLSSDIGTSRQLPEGRYRLEIRNGSKVLTTPVVIRNGKTTRVLLAEEVEKITVTEE
jgi:hypothetical protein